MKINYILTAFSPAMFGAKATAHIRLIEQDEARQMVSDSTKIVATRVSHERLAKNIFSGIQAEMSRFANLTPGTNAIHIQYRGPIVGDDGVVPTGGHVSLYLIEVEEYHEE